VFLDRSIYKGKNSRISAALSVLSDIKCAQGDYETAKQLSEEAISNYAAVFGDYHLVIGTSRTALSDIYLKLGRVTDAEREGHLALDILRRTALPDHQFTASAEHFLGLALLAADKVPEAKLQLENAAHRWQRARAPEWWVARSESALGEALARLGDQQQADALLKHSLNTLERDLGKSHPTTREARTRLERFSSSRVITKLSNNDTSSP